jgi:hypothetical protein
MNDWHVEQLTLRLPAAFAARAPRIAAAIGDALSALPALPDGATLAALRVPPLRLHAAASDSELARAIAHAIAHAIAGALPRR